MSWTIWISAGAILGGLSTALGAFGAHVLKDRLSEHYLNVFETAVRYQMYHALTLLALGLVATRIEGLMLKLSGVSFILGVLLFSGSLYLLVLTGQKFWGMITPIGGLALIIGWLLLFNDVVKV